MAGQVIQMPGRKQRRMMQMRYGIRGLGRVGDANTDPTATPWYQNPIVIMGAMLGGGLLLGHIARPHVERAGKRARQKVSQIDWGHIGTVAGTALVSYYVGKALNSSTTV